MDVAANGQDLLVVTENGFGKRTSIEDYRVTNRGGKGIKTLKKTAKTGRIIGAKMVDENNEIMLISLEGIMIRLPVADISCMGRDTQGVILMKLGEDDKVVAAAHLAAKDDE